MHEWLIVRNKALTAQKLLTRYDFILPPINVYQLARKMDIDVFAEENTDYSGRLNVDIETSKVSIYVNAKESEERKRFTVAHEIGHLILHDIKNGGDLFRDKNFAVKDTKEAQANGYAANLLVPMWLLKIIAPKYNYKVDQLCKVFIVSSKVMSIRLWKMGGVHKELWDDV